MSGEKESTSVRLVRRDGRKNRGLMHEDAKFRERVGCEIGGEGGIRTLDTDQGILP